VWFSINKDMISELNVYFLDLSSFSTKEDINERILEIWNLINGNISRRIISKAATNLPIPITIDEDKDVNKFTITLTGLVIAKAILQ
jgi:hypothetical protein